MVDRAVHASVGHHLVSRSSSDKSEEAALIREDFSKAMNDFLPVAMREVSKSAPDSGRAGWDDVGGLIDIQKAIKEVPYLLFSDLIEIYMISCPEKFIFLFFFCLVTVRRYMEYGMFILQDN